jgi:hypothetical protein
VLGVWVEKGKGESNSIGGQWAEQELLSGVSTWASQQQNKVVGFAGYLQSM